MRWLYERALPLTVRRKINVPREVPFEVYAYSGENSLPEQVASIRSFLAYAGRPKQFTVVSDGSYSSGSIRLLETIDRCVRVRQTAPPLPPNLPDKVHTFLASHFTGKQIAVIMSLPANGPALYTDSDVLFFPGAYEIVILAQKDTGSALYQVDYDFSGDDRLVRHATEKERPANMGFLLLFKKLDWSVGLERLRALDGVPNYFTTQTFAHLCLHANAARPFDPQTFVLQLDDQTIYSDKYATRSIAMRHYVNPVRHKFWTTLAHRGFC